ncbi:1-deoxy-D-xylulose 5-phosphate reductoisomerase (plasmid) [Pseudoseohaeicola sp. NH-UV-7]|jgi:1-deoxy-D-xylulose-5-phosphate reductoisomerase|uniref:1-deoxy-D-xylulose-5-phosphate reductoisomerase n=1 Tax=unclassified Sulfitobacter TaxID=196795 RepID=UPI000E0CB50B|nr:1-deoxy-D-xylulose-5-phosphate reductoisomerase [Sulfitobacter sp. JL08]AXI54691.1 1-deoxy-D-xylulose-5-phosphate reductoisomerase [Sulfitobacter sp. JL08]
MRQVSVLGATGSVGQNTIDLIRRSREDYDVVALTGDQNIAQLAQDAKDLRAQVAVTADPDRLDDLRAALAGSEVEAAAGLTALTEAAARPADWIMSAIVGAAGLAPGLAALKQGCTLALANKESLVCAGALMLDTAHRNGAHLIPVDSEHSAVFQALVGEDIGAVETVTITSSGGAFRDWPIDDLAQATVAQASTHPNFAMGQRITIDSATMFNKSMEVIEARELFDLEPDQIKVLIQPEQIIHAIVAFRDGGLMAHLGAPDMRHAIGYALHWPDRRDLPVERLDLAQIGSLSFKTPDTARYPALRLAGRVMESRGLSGAVFNGAKERALDAFIAGRIGFLQMAEVVERVLDALSARSGLIDATMTLDIVAQTDHLAREHADIVMKNLDR